MPQRQTLADSEAPGLVTAPPFLPASRLFTCTRSDARAGAVRVRVSGELDLSTAAWLERELRDAQAEASQVVLDLRKLTFMDCSGMHVIVGAAQRARRAGHKLTVVPGPVQVERVFTLTGAAAVIEIAAVTY